MYFASQWDQRYEPLFESHDPGEEPLPGGNLYARYGKGVYMFTAYSWFRQLPAGAPGAFRIFANFLSAVFTRVTVKVHTCSQAMPGSGNCRPGCPERSASSQFLERRKRALSTEPRPAGTVKISDQHP